MDWLLFTFIVSVCCGLFFRAWVTYHAVAWIERREQVYGYSGLDREPGIPWFVRLYYRLFV